MSSSRPIQDQDADASIRSKSDTGGKFKTNLGSGLDREGWGHQGTPSRAPSLAENDNRLRSSESKIPDAAHLAPKPRRERTPEDRSSKSSKSLKEEPSEKMSSREKYLAERSRVEESAGKESPRKKARHTSMRLKGGAGQCLTARNADVLAAERCTSCVVQETSCYASTLHSGWGLDTLKCGNCQEAYTSLLLRGGGDRNAGNKVQGPDGGVHDVKGGRAVKDKKDKSRSTTNREAMKGRKDKSGRGGVGTSEQRVKQNGGAKKHAKTREEKGKGQHSLDEEEALRDGQKGKERNCDRDEEGNSCSHDSVSVSGEGIMMESSGEKREKDGGDRYDDPFSKLKDRRETGSNKKMVCSEESSGEDQEEVHRQKKGRLLKHAKGASSDSASSSEDREEGQGSQPLRRGSGPQKKDSDSLSVSENSFDHDEDGKKGTKRSGGGEVDLRGSKWARQGRGLDAEFAELRRNKEQGSEEDQDEDDTGLRRKERVKASGEYVDEFEQLRGRTKERKKVTNKKVQNVENDEDVDDDDDDGSTIRFDSDEDSDAVRRRVEELTGVKSSQTLSANMATVDKGARATSLARILDDELMRTARELK